MLTPEYLNKNISFVYDNWKMVWKGNMEKYMYVRFFFNFIEKVVVALDLYWCAYLLT